MSDACCVFEVPFGATLRIPWAQVVGLQTSSSVWSSSGPASASSAR